jgi:phosphatidylserine decarboxylase
MLNNYIGHAPELLVIFMAALLISYAYKNKKLAIASIIIFIGLLYFYRGWSSPRRTRQNELMCPCEGRVLKIIKGADYVQIAIFLNVHNIHVQYIPIDGIVTSIYHKAGEFAPAYLFEKSQYNERIETSISSEYGDVKVVQIAGQIARRAVSFLSEGQKVQQAQPMGLIKFGSRVDVYVPRESIKNILVSEGDAVSIGDVLASLQ